MAENQARSAYRKDLKRRTMSLRKRRGFTQLQMATALRVSLERYKKWEQRGSLPADYQAAFAAIVGESVQYVNTGIHTTPSLTKPRQKTG